MEISPLLKRVFNSRLYAFNSDMDKGNGAYNQAETQETTTDLAKSNLVSSKLSTNNGLHMPVIDMDYEVYLIPSSPGKNHLYINKPMTFANYEKLLKTLLEVGLIDQGNYNQFTKYGSTFVRLPTQTKPNAYLKVDEEPFLNTGEDINPKKQSVSEILSKYKTIYAENKALKTLLLKANALNKKLLAEKNAKEKESTVS